MAARRLLKWTGLGLGGLVLLILAVGGGLYLWLRTSLPQVDGTVAVAGLHGAVTIRRDADGVPRISAGDAHDAAFALGFVHAQDRLFQMDVLRRYGAGQLAEIAGKALAPRDEFMRTVGLARAAEAQMQHLDPGARDQLQAYADGVNAYITSHAGARFPAYYVLPGPRKWRPVDSLIIRNLLAFYLAKNFRLELLHARIAREVSADELKTLFPNYPDDTLVTLAQLDDIFRRLPIARMQAAAPRGLPVAEASNNWVVDGRHTASGKPILENDPHLAYTAPSIWYLARVDYPGYQFAGGAIPGEPFLVVGHNGHVGWGFTETGGDVEDLFIEKVDPDDPTRYLTPDGWKRFATRREVIHVKGGKDVVITVRSTRHGPVISDVAGDLRASRAETGIGASLDGASATEPKAGYVMALQATFLDADDRTAQAFLRMNRARDWTQFRAALRDFAAPQMNIVFADTAGHIGLIAPGRIPIRKHGHGWMPHPGWTGEYDWTGYIPFDALPQGEDPASGRFISANNKIVPDSYPFFISSDWAPPYRADRIAALLSAEPTQTLQTTARIALDDDSLMARQLLPQMLAALPPRARSTPAVRELRSWNGRMDRGQAAPLIFAAWLRQFVRVLFADKLDGAFDGYWAARGETVAAVLKNPGPWCGAKGDPGCAKALETSLSAALRGLGGAGAAGHERWGERHRARFSNPAFSQVPLVGGLFNPAIAADGGQETVNTGIMDFNDQRRPFRAIAGPSLRMILDFSDLSRSRFMVAPGVSENPLSGHYADLLRRWRDGDWIEFSQAPVRHRLVLEPKAAPSERPQE